MMGAVLRLCDGMVSVYHLAHSLCSDVVMVYVCYSTC